jgi:hypothetical protein
MIRVSFSKTEHEILVFIGKMRHAVTSALGTERKQDQRQDGEQMAINGVITEYAASKALNLHFDLNCDFRKFGADLMSRRGATIDVKSTSQAGGNLNAVGWSGGKPAEIFVLTEIHHAHVLIVGWIHRDDFLRDENLRDVGNGSFYSVPQSKLNLFYEQESAKTL